MRLDPALDPVVNRPDFQIRLSHPKGFFYLPRMLVIFNNQVFADLGICEVALQSVPPAFLFDFSLVEGNADLPFLFQEFVVATVVDVGFS
jgi:hypothetical protein